MRLLVLVLIFLGTFLMACCQSKYDYNWLFGYGSGVYDSTRPFGGVIMSFNDGKINFYPQSRDFEFNAQTNSFSDSDGNLKLMSNGCFIANDNAKLLINGDSIGYGKIWGINCPKYQPLLQAGVFLNNKKRIDTITFLHNILDTIGNGSKAFLKCIYETKIDLLTSNVISKNKIILYDTLYGGITAISSNNDTEWWIIAPKYRTNEFYIVQYEGIEFKSIVKQRIGEQHDPIGIGTAQVAFSTNGNMFAIYIPIVGLQVFNFDRTSGLLSNKKFYPIFYNVNNSIGGCAFSPDSRFVYVSNPTEVLQVDLLEQDSTKAIDTVGVYDNFFDPYPATYMQMALGPDCRIYITAGGGNQYLHVILYPNRKGKDCQLINRGLKLPTRNSHATPNFPHYRVDEPYPCDSTIRIQLNTDVDEAFKFRQGELLLYPNPAKSELIVQDIQNLIPGKVNIRLFSIQGQLISEMQTDNAGEEMRIPVLNLNTGMYIIQLRNEKGRYWMSKFLKD